MTNIAPNEEPDEEPAPCGRCGRLHFRMGFATCVAHRRNGMPCMKFRRPGMTVCELHGGMAPQAILGAEKRRADSIAQANIRKLMSAELVSAGIDPQDLPYVDPIQNLLFLVATTSQAVESLAERVAELSMPDPDDTGVGDMRDLIGVDDDGEPIHIQPRAMIYGPNLRGELVTHPLYREWKDMLKMNAAFSKMAIEAGVAERMSRMNDAMGEAIAQAVDLALGDLAIPPALRSEARLRVSMRLAELDKTVAILTTAAEKILDNPLRSSTSYGLL